MSALDYGVFIASLGTLFAYVCRLASLNWRTHKPWIVMLHVSQAIFCGANALEAWHADISISNVAGVIGAMAWIVVSYHTWRYGVPSQFTSRPMPLDDDELQHVVGGSNADRG